MIAGLTTGQLVIGAVGALVLYALQRFGVAPKPADPQPPAPASPATPLLNVLIPAGEEVLKGFLQQAFARLAQGSLVSHAAAVSQPAPTK